MSNPITASPLTWPDGWKRFEGERIQAPFGTRAKNDHGYNALRRKSVAEATAGVLEQLRIMHCKARCSSDSFINDNVIISTNLALRMDGYPRSNQRAPEDPGASVWWLPNDDAKSYRVIAIDRYDRVADNLYAIAKTLEAMRGIERWGGGEILERTFSGFVALPPPGQTGGMDPYQLLEISPDMPVNEQRLGYRKALSRAHRADDTDHFMAVKAAGKTLELT